MSRGRLAVHAHFYQPSRLDPWTGRVPVEPSAAPFHDWNERVNAECYRPNAERGTLAPHLLEPRPDARRVAGRGGSRRPTQRFIADRPDGDRPGRSTTRSCRWPRRPIGGPRSPGASATSRSGSDDARPGCGCPRRPSTSRRSRAMAEAGHRVHDPRPVAGGRRRGRHPPSPTASSWATTARSSSIFYDAGLSTSVSFEPEATADADRFARERVAPRLSGGPDPRSTGRSR